MSQHSVNSGHNNLLCKKCGRNYQGECKAGSDRFFGCGKPGYKVRDCSRVGY